jgi:adenylate kinase
MNLLIFGPNGSGKGTQSGKLKAQFQLEHVESGGIFRENIQKQTPLGQKAKSFIDRGELVPDDITIPMILDRLSAVDPSRGWILDGFPRNPSQSLALWQGLAERNLTLDRIIIIEVRREVARQRLLGRRSCPNGHPNNTAIPAIAPILEGGVLVCHHCGAAVTERKDDLDEKAIDQRLDIYFDQVHGTLASIQSLEQLIQQSPATRLIRVDGEGEIQAVANAIEATL